MSERETRECLACGHVIDEVATICPYCAADPSTGKRGGSKSGVGEVIPRRPPTTAMSRIATTIRSRSGMFLGISLVVGIALLIGISSWVNQRQRSAADVPPIPLTEVTDLGNESDTTPEPLEMPELEFEHDGNPSTLETFVTEPGEVAPPPPEEMENEE